MEEIKLLGKIKKAIHVFREKPVTLQQIIDSINQNEEEAAVSEATYFTCLKTLAESIGKMPLKLLQRNEKDGIVTARGHPLYYTIKEHPNPYMTASSFWGTMELNRNHYGNAYALIDGAGDKTKLWILDSEKIQIWYDDKKLFSQIPDIYYIYSSPIGKIKFSSQEILHFKNFYTNDGIVGISVQEQLKNTIRGNAKSQKMINNLYDNGFVAKAVLQYTGSLNDENARIFAEGIENYATGKVGNIKNIIPVPVGANIVPLNIKLGENQFLEVRQYSALQIAAAFGIKPYQIGDYTKSSYASAEAQQLSFYIDTLLYIIKQYEEEITYKMLSSDEIKNGLHFKFNVGVILRADFKTQIETLAKAVESFIYTPNEARAFLDLAAKEGGDKLLGNGAAIPVEMIGKQYEKEESGKE